MMRSTLAAVGATALAVTSAAVPVLPARALRPVVGIADGGGSAEDRPAVPASAGDIAAVCALLPRFQANLQVRRSNRPQPHWERLRRMSWKALPATVTCGGVRTVLKPAGFGEFVTEVAQASGGQVVALRGGAQLGPLAGAGGECIYRRTPRGYAVEVCVQSWIS